MPVPSMPPIQDGDTGESVRLRLNSAIEGLEDLGNAVEADVETLQETVNAISSLPPQFKVTQFNGGEVIFSDAKRQRYLELDPTNGHFKSSQFDQIDARFGDTELRLDDLEAGSGGGSGLPSGLTVTGNGYPIFTDSKKQHIPLTPPSALMKHPTMKITIVGGQSLSTGTDSITSANRTISNTQTLGNLMFIDGLTQLAGLETYTWSTPLVECVNDSKDGVFDSNGNLINNAYGETPCSGYANTYAARTGISHMMLCTGEGGQRISQLTYRTYYGQRILTQVLRAYQILLAQGYDVEVDNILWCNGESDQTTGVKRTSAEYAYDMHSMHKWLEVEIKKITGQTTNVNWIMYQTSSHQYYRDDNINATTQIVEAYQLAASLYPRMYVSHPMHHLWYVDGVHLPADSSLIMGKYFARSAESILRTGTWRPMELTAVTRSGNDFLLTYYTPTGSVALNSYMPLANGGVSLTQADGFTPLGIETGLTIENASTYRLSCSSFAPAGSMLFTGRGSNSGTKSAGYHMPNNTRNVGNDLCDSKTDEVHTYVDTTAFNGTTRPATLVMRNPAVIERKVVA